MGRRAAGDERADGLTVTVLVPSYRRPEMLLRCLDGVLAGTRRPEQIVVVLRASDAESQEAIAAWRARRGRSAGVVEVTLADEPGQAQATNAGLTVARGDVICFIDDDTVPTKEWLERLLAHYVEAGVVGVGGRDLVYHGEAVSADPQPLVGRLTWYGRIIGNHHQPACDGACEVAHLKGANMSFRREVVSGFDTNIIGAHLTDTDVSLSAGRHGRLIYDPRAAVHHYPAPRTGGFNRQPEVPKELRADAHDVAYVMLKHLPRRRRAGFWLLALLIGQHHRYGLLRMIVMLPMEGTVAVRRWWAAMRGLFDARTTLCRTRQGSEDGGHIRPS